MVGNITDVKNSILDTKADFKTVIDTAKEIKAGGESAHQVVGEISMSLERLLKLGSKLSTIKHTDGRVEETREPLDEEYIKNQIVERFFKETRDHLKLIYDNQKRGRNFRKWEPIRWALAAFLFAAGVIILQKFLVLL